MRREILQAVMIVIVFSASGFAQTRVQGEVDRISCLIQQASGGATCEMQR